MLMKPVAGRSPLLAVLPAPPYPHSPSHPCSPFHFLPSLLLSRHRFPSFFVIRDVDGNTCFKKAAGLDIKAPHPWKHADSTGPNPT